jgi:hypothetical protein
VHTTVIRIILRGKHILKFFYSLITYLGAGWGVKIICALGGAHCKVPLSGVARVISSSSASSGLTGQLAGSGRS